MPSPLNGIDVGSLTQYGYVVWWVWRPGEQRHICGLASRLEDAATVEKYANELVVDCEVVRG